MNYELFITKKIIFGKGHKSNISSPIIKIAIVAITLGIAIMLISVSIFSGFQEKIRDKISGFKGHIQITNYDNNNSDISIIPIDKNQSFYPKFSNINGIKNIQIYTNKGGIIRTKDSFEGIIFKGVSTDYDLSFFKEYLTKGRLPDFHQKRNREILISKSISDKLNLKLGDTIQAVFSTENSKNKFKIRKPIIVGIYNSGFEQFDKSIILGDIREVQRINGWNENQIGGFEVLINDFDKITEKGNEIYNNIPSTLNSQTVVENHIAIFEWINLLDNNVWFIIAIMIIVAGINMITALLVIILERVQMIGILKALGAQNNSIRKIFLYNAVYIIIKGLFYGNVIGITLLLIQKYGEIISLNPETYYVSTVPVNINIITLILLNLGTLLLCFIMLIVPSMLISKISPSKSIKFD